MKQHLKEHLGDKPLPAVVGGGDGRIQSNMAIANEEAKILGVINKRLPLQFSNSHDSGKKREIRNSRWLRRGIIVEVTEGGKRRVSTGYIPLRADTHAWVAKQNAAQVQVLGHFGDNSSGKKGTSCF